MPGKEPPFLGTGWRFPPRFDRDNGEVAMVSGDEDIHQSLIILMTTIAGERIMRPRYGLGLQTEVFSKTDETNLTHLRGRIKKAVRFFEPRIRLESVIFDTSTVREGLLGIELDYGVPSTNSRGNMVYPYYFREGTHVEAL
ncbi:MAG: GPW/gp25 family protein [Geminicoccaceae bacterium]